MRTAVPPPQFGAGGCCGRGDRIAEVEGIFFVDWSIAAVAVATAAATPC